MQIFIGQIHSPGSLDRDDFDYLVAKTTEAELITTIKLEYVQRVVHTGLETEEELNSLKALLNVNSKDDMIAWFENHYDYFSFNIHLVHCCPVGRMPESAPNSAKNHLATKTYGSAASNAGAQK